MSVVDVKPKSSGGRAAASGDRQSQTYAQTKAWTVKCSSRKDDELDALGAPGLPRVGDIDAKRICVDLAVNRIATSCVFEVVAEYRSLKTTGSGAARAGSILDNPPQISWGFAGRVQQVDVTADGLPCVNTAGVALDPPLVRDFQDRTITVVRNERSFNSVAADDWADTVNSDRFFGYSAGLVRCLPIAASEVYEGANKFYQVTYNFLVRFAKWAGERPGWRRRIWNTGRTTVDWETHKSVLIMDDKESNPITEPVPLDPEGAPIIIGESLKSAGRTWIGHEFKEQKSDRGVIGIWVYYDLFEERSFRSLRLP